MLKWIGGGCLVLLLCVGVVSYMGYRQMASLAAKGPSVSVAMAATPERVFATLASGDSIYTWGDPASGMSLRTTRSGPFEVGDTIFVTMRRDSVSRSVWIVDTIVPNVLIERRWVTLKGNMVLQRRRDSVAGAGDSTHVTSTITATIVDSATASRRQATGVSGGLLDMATTMGTAGARIEAEQQLRWIKAHIERTAAPTGLKAKTVVPPDSR